MRIPIIGCFLILALILNHLTSYVNVSSFISRIPFKTGNNVRYNFYRLTLNKCGKNVTINFGTIISYRDTCIGNNVWLGTYNILGHVDIDDDVITAQGCHLISQGKITPTFNTTKIPMHLQNIDTDKIRIGPDVWIGAGSIVGVNIKKGTIITAGSGLANEAPEYSILIGNPAVIISNRLSNSIL
jgi:virginiamycin A acetyltransferase